MLIRTFPFFAREPETALPINSFESADDNEPSAAIDGLASDPLFRGTRTGWGIADSAACAFALDDRNSADGAFAEKGESEADLLDPFGFGCTLLKGALLALATSPFSGRGVGLAEFATEDSSEFAKWSLVRPPKEVRLIRL